jgi:hypothetical protein
MKKTDFLVLIMCSMIILISGCINSVKTPAAATTTPTATVSYSTHMATPTPIGHEFIIVDPIGNHTAGDVFFINGTTNLPVTRNLTLYLGPGCVLNHGIGWWTLEPEPSIISNIPIVSGSSGTNHWSYNATDAANHNFGWKIMNCTAPSQCLECQHWFVYTYENGNHTDSHGDNNFGGNDFFLFIAN